MEEFIYILVVFSLIYLVAVKAVMLKTGMKEVNKIREDFNSLNKRLTEATKKKDSDEIDRLMKEQQEMMPKMMSMFGSQMKMTLVILVVFMSFVWVLNSIDPYVKDDIFYNNVNGTLNQSFNITNPDMEAFKITAKSTNNEMVSGYIYVSQNRNILTNLSTDKHSIYPIMENDRIRLESANISVFESVQYDNGTDINNFVPILDILGIRFVYGAQGTFILLTFIVSMAEQALLGKRISDALEKIIK
jgi:hypothetical protein